jgi:transcriptional regulator with XRE-family HTH domain
MPAKPLSSRQLKDARRLKEAFRRWCAQRRAGGEGASQRHAAGLMGFGQSAMSQYLSGRIPLNAQALAKFAELLGVAPESISPHIVREQRALSQNLAEPPVALNLPVPAGVRTAGFPRELLERAGAVAEIAGRTVEQQLVYWARLGAAAELSLTTGQALALLTRESSLADDAPARVAARHAVHEAQVAAGERAARSLVVVPGSLARGAKLTYPKDAFGGSQPW